MTFGFDWRLLKYKFFNVLTEPWQGISSAGSGRILSSEAASKIALPNSLISDIADPEELQGETRGG
jgi:hypothetical protein